MNIDGSNNIQLFYIDQRYGQIPQFMADQSKVYYYDDALLHICDIDGQNYYPYTFDIDYAPGSDYIFPNNGITSTRDGNRLLFAARLNNATNYSIVTLGVNSHSLEIILEDSGNNSEILPVFSKDENKLCFRRFNNSSGYDNLYTMDRDGGNLFNLTKDRAPSCYAQFFSPDDQNIFFTGKPSGHQTIYMVDIQGDSVIQISDENKSAGGGNIVFTEDGHSIYYIVYNEIKKYDLINHTTIHIFNHDIRLRNLVISNKHLYFTDGTLMRIDLDGSNLKELSNPGDRSFSFQIQPILH
jgi:Tol biopolymer transport system component